MLNVHIPPRTEWAYEKKPNRPTPFDWVAPEHYRFAQHMTRRNGEFVITLNPIFEYSRKNPPAFLAGNIKR